MILKDTALKQMWQEELSVMQARVQGLRNSLAELLVDKSGSEYWGFIAQQKGMFSLLGTSDEGVQTLKNEYGIYVVKGGRVNIAGLRHNILERVADAFLKIS